MNTSEKIEVMQSYLDGAAIELRTDNGWEYTDNPSWDWVNFNYRVKVDSYAKLKVAAADPTKQIRDKVAGTPWMNGIAWLNKDGNYVFDLPASHYEIRTKPTQVKLLAWLDDNYMFWRTEKAGGLSYWRRAPSEDKLVEVEE